MSNSRLSRWQTVSVVGLLSLVTAGCGGHGPKVEHGKIDVHYTGGATKEEADRLGPYLVKTWGNTPDRRSVQIKKTADGYQFRMVVKKEFQNDDQTLKGLEIDGAKISRDVFDGAAVEVHACDEHLKTVKTYPPRPDIRYGVVDGKVEVFVAKEADKADARQLAKYVAGLLKDAPEPLYTLKLARRDGVVEVHMVSKLEVLKNPAIMAALRNDTKAIADNVFKGATVEMHLCDARLNVLEVLKP